MNKIKTLFIKNKIVNFRYYKHIFLVSVIYLYAYILLTFINIYAKNLAELELLAWRSNSLRQQYRMIARTARSGHDNVETSRPSLSTQTGAGRLRDGASSRVGLIAGS